MVHCEVGPVELPRSSMRNAMRRTGSRSSFSNSSSPLTLPSVTSRSESPAPLPDRKGGRTGPLHLVYHGKGKGRTLSIVGATTGRIYSERMP